VDRVTRFLVQILLAIGLTFACGHSSASAGVGLVLMMSNPVEPPSPTRSDAVNLHLGTAPGLVDGWV
jgi:hypothetical protein